MSRVLRVVSGVFLSWCSISVAQPFRTLPNFLLHNPALRSSFSFLGLHLLGDWILFVQVRSKLSEALQLI